MYFAYTLKYVIAVLQCCVEISDYTCIRLEPPQKRIPNLKLKGLAQVRISAAPAGGLDFCILSDVSLLAGEALPGNFAESSGSLFQTRQPNETGVRGDFGSHS